MSTDTPSPALLRSITLPMMEDNRPILGFLTEEGHVCIVGEGEIRAIVPVREYGVLWFAVYLEGEDSGGLPGGRVNSACVNAVWYTDQAKAAL